MASTKILESQYFVDIVKTNLEEEINKVADEVIKQAQEDIDKKIRGKTAMLAAAIVDKYYSIERMQDNLVITVKHYYKGENDG